MKIQEREKKLFWAEKTIGRHKREKGNENVWAGVILYYKNINSVKISARVLCKYCFIWCI